MKRVRTILIFALLASGCSRGCLRTWFEEHGVVGRPPIVPGAVDPSAEQVLCPGGIAKCSSGIVLVSKSEKPQACSPEGCRCSWNEVGRCNAGCVVEGLEVEMSREKAASQLCLDGPDRSVAQANDSPDSLAEACDGPGAACHEGMLASCHDDGGVTLLGRCNCAAAIVFSEVAERDPAVAARILCSAP